MLLYNDVYNEENSCKMRCNYSIFIYHKGDYHEYFIYGNSPLLRLQEVKRQIRAQHDQLPRLSFCGENESETDFLCLHSNDALHNLKFMLYFSGMDEPTGTQVPSMFLNFLGSSIDWGYRTEPESGACLGEKERRCYWPRGKVYYDILL